MDDSCPVCRTAEVVCGKWTLLLVRDLAEGHTRFCELERSLQGISPRTLSLRLRVLEGEGVVERQTLAGGPAGGVQPSTGSARRAGRLSAAPRGAATRRPGGTAGGAAAEPAVADAAPVAA